MKIKLKDNSKIYVIGAGKASYGMLKAVLDIFGSNINSGIICTNQKQSEFDLPANIECVLGGHPYPNVGSLNGAMKILEMVQNLTENDLVLCLISGGGSALMEAPLNDLTLHDLSIVFDVLTRVGATIHELNTVRKHLSKIKGGKLAKAMYPATVITLIISDVVGNKVDSIASGPTTSDTSSWKEVKEIIEKYKLSSKLPSIVNETIQEGLDGIIEENPKESEIWFKKVKNIIVASNDKACNEMKKKSESIGFHSIIKSTSITGEAKKIGKEIASEILAKKGNYVLIAGGETTVNILGDGLGGRCQELVLSAGELIGENDEILIAAIGTDGKDGPTDAAGALIDSVIISNAEKKGINMKSYLEKNNSYNFFKETTGLIKTGITGTNVMDLIVAIRINKKS